MIQLVDNKESGNPKNKFRLLIDGHDLNANVRNFRIGKELYININAKNLEATNLIYKYKFNDFPNLKYLTFPIKRRETDYLERVYIEYNPYLKKIEISFRYNSDLKLWKERSNYLQFYGNYSRYIADLNYKKSKVARNLDVLNLKPQIKTLSHKDFSFEVNFAVNKLNNLISEEVQF